MTEIKKIRRELPACQTRTAILLATYQGAKYLADQLESIHAQTYQEWTIFAADDGSTDQTTAILTDYANSWPDRMNWKANDSQKGFTGNFLSLVTDPAISCCFYAFCDQDDMWEPEKLEHAVNWLQTIPRDEPALYFSRTLAVDADNRPLAVSRRFRRKPSFSNALVQSIGGGNTMVFNEAARQILCKAKGGPDVVSHDWWAYTLITGCGGWVENDARPLVRYRQHADNVSGSNRGLRAMLIRMKLVWAGRFRGWNESRIRGLLSASHILTLENRRALSHFAAARNGHPLQRMVHLWRSGVYRQTRIGTMALYVAALFKRI